MDIKKKKPMKLIMMLRIVMMKTETQAKIITWFLSKTPLSLDTAIIKTDSFLTIKTIFSEALFGFLRMLYRNGSLLSERKGVIYIINFSITYHVPCKFFMIQSKQCTHGLGCQHTNFERHNDIWHDMKFTHFGTDIWKYKREMKKIRFFNQEFSFHCSFQMLW